MPVLCNMRKNLPLPDVPLKSKILNVILVSWSPVLPETLKTHRVTSASLLPPGEGYSQLSEPTRHSQTLIQKAPGCIAATTEGPQLHLEAIPLQVMFCILHVNPVNTRNNWEYVADHSKPFCGPQIVVLGTLCIPNDD
eukprot:1139561-Pelagomonas_calceolata.AAC.2